MAVKAFGADAVAIADIKRDNLDLAMKLGADVALNPDRDAAPQEVATWMRAALPLMALTWSLTARALSQPCRSASCEEAGQHRQHVAVAAAAAATASVSKPLHANLTLLQIIEYGCMERRS